MTTKLYNTFDQASTIADKINEGYAARGNEDHIAFVSIIVQEGRADRYAVAVEDSRNEIELLLQEDGSLAVEDRPTA